MTRQQFRNWLCYPATWRVVLTAALLYGGCLLYALKTHQYDPSGFVFLGKQNPNASDPAYDAVQRRTTTAGYDGQYYYAVATQLLRVPNPLLDDQVRSLRILYPLVCWACSAGGQPQLLLWAMPGVNCVLILLLCALGCVACRRANVSCWWAVALPLCVHALVPALRNLTDLTGMVLIFAVALAWESRTGWGWIGLLSVLAVLAREQNIALIVLLVCVSWMQHHWRMVVSLLIGAVGLAVYLAWLRWNLGYWPLLGSGGNIAAPGVGLVHWYHWQSHHAIMWAIRVLFAVHLGFQVAFVLPTLRLRQQHTHAPWLMAVLGSGLLIVAGPSITDDWWSYTRNFFWLPLAGWWAMLRFSWQWRFLSLLLAMPAQAGHLHYL